MSPLVLLGLQAALAADLVEQWTLEADDAGLTVEGDEGQWEWGVFPTSYGPMGGASGVAGWATRLDRPYLNEAESALVLPPHALGALGRPVLELVHWYSVDSSDVGWVEALRGGVWERLEPAYGYPTASGISGQSAGWGSAFLDLEGVADLSDVRLVLSTDASVQLAGWYIDALRLWDGDAVPPQVLDLDALADTEDLTGPYPVSVLALDDVGVAWVELRWEVNGVEQDPLPMALGGDGRWQAQLPGLGVPDTAYVYRVLASDGTNLTRSPEAGGESFRARLLPPTGLQGPEGRVVDTVAALSWTPPASTMHACAGYRVWRADTLLAEVSEPSAEVPLVGGGEDVFTVSAVYAAGEGDRSAAWGVDSYVPEVLEVYPDAVWPGDTLHLRVSGRYLLLSEGDVELALGEDLEVEALTVESVDALTARVRVLADAAPGPRTLALRSGAVSLELPEALEVRGDGASPRLLTLTPDSMRQGESATLLLTLSAVPALLPEVDLGEGVIVETVVWSGDASVQVTAVADPNAPIGERGVQLDDGTRVLSGVTLRVRDNVQPPSRVCGTATGRGGWLAGGWLALAVLTARLRRARSGDADPAGVR